MTPQWTGGMQGSGELIPRVSLSSVLVPVPVPAAGSAVSRKSAEEFSAAHLTGPASAYMQQASSQWWQLSDILQYLILVLVVLPKCFAMVYMLYIYIYLYIFFFFFLAEQDSPFVVLGQHQRRSLPSSLMPEQILRS